MYVQPSKALAHELRSATILLKNKILIALLKEAADRIEDLEKIAEHYRAKAEEVLTDETKKEKT